MEANPLATLFSMIQAICDKFSMKTFSEDKEEAKTTDNKSGSKQSIQFHKEGKEEDRADVDDLSLFVETGGLIQESFYQNLIFIWSWIHF